MKRLAMMLGLVLGLSPLAGTAQDTVLYRHDTAACPTNKRPAGFQANVVIAEQDGGKYLSYRGGYGYLCRPSLMRYLGAARWRNIALSFRFRLPDATKNGFTVIVKNAGWRPAGVQYGCYYIGIGKDDVKATPSNASAEDTARYTLKKVTYADVGLSALQTGVWYCAKAVVTDTNLEFHIEQNGKMTKVIGGEVLPGGGGIDVLTYAPVDLADILVTEPAVLTAQGDGRR